MSAQRQRPDVLEAGLHLFDTVLLASEEKAVEKLKQLLACVVDTIVVEGRDHIHPYYFVPGVLTVFPSRRRTGIEPAWELSPPHRF